MDSQEQIIYKATKRVQDDIAYGDYYISDQDVEDRAKEVKKDLTQSRSHQILLGKRAE